MLEKRIHVQGCCASPRQCWVKTQRMKAGTTEEDLWVMTWADRSKWCSLGLQQPKRIVFCQVDEWNCLLDAGTNKFLCQVLIPQPTEGAARLQVITKGQQNWSCMVSGKEWIESSCSRGSRWDYSIATYLDWRRQSRTWSWVQTVNSINSYMGWRVAVWKASRTQSASSELCCRDEFGAESSWQ